MRVFLLSALLVLATLMAHAQEPEFATSEEEIIQGLTTRGLGKTRSFNPNPPKTRAIKVLMKKEEKVVSETIYVSEDDTADRVNLKIEFDYNSYAIRPNSYTLVSELGRALLRPELEHKTVFINGHTDSDGSEMYNQELSLNRAQAVKGYLVGNFDIDPSRLRVVGFGEAMPLMPNTNAAYKQMNRRVEVKVE